MAEPEIKLRLSADGSAAVAGINKVGASLNKFGSATGSLISKIKTHWLGFTAAIAGTMFALSKAWSLADMAAQFEEQKASINSLAAQYNVSGSVMIKNIQEAARGLISMADAADIGAKALNLSLNPDQITRFTVVAEKMTDVIGGEIPEAFDKMVIAAATGRLQTLAQMGVVLDLDEAMKKEAASMGKQIESLTALEKQQMRTNIILEAAEKRVSALGDSIDTNKDKMDRLKYTVQDLQLHIGTGLIRVTLGAAGAFQWLAAGVMNAIGALAYLAEKGGWVSAVISPLGMILKKAGVDSATAFATAEELAGKSVDNFSAMIAKSEDLAGAMAKIESGISSENLAKSEEDLKKYYSSLQSLHATAMDQMKSKSQELLQVEQQIRQSRMSTEDLLFDIKTKDMDAWRKNYDTRKHLEEKFDMAMQLSGEEKINLLNQLQQNWFSLTDAVVENGNEVISASSAQYTAMGKIKEIGAEITNEQLKKKSALETEISTWQQVEAKAVAAMEQIKTAITNLPEEKKLNIDASKALGAIDEIKSKLDSIPDVTTKTVIIKTYTESSPIKPFSEGIAYMQEKLNSLSGAGEYTMDLSALSSLVGVYTDIAQMIAPYAQKAATTGHSRSFFEADYTSQLGAELRAIQQLFSPVTNTLERIFSKFAGSFQTGTSYVPQTGFAFVHRGEQIIPVHKSSQSEGSFGQVTYAPVININGANKSPQQIATEVDKVLAKRARYNRSEFAKEIN